MPTVKLPKIAPWRSQWPHRGSQSTLADNPVRPVQIPPKTPINVL